MLPPGTPYAIFTVAPTGAAPCVAVIRVDRFYSCQTLSRSLRSALVRSVWYREPVVRKDALIALERLLKRCVEQPGLLTAEPLQWLIALGLLCPLLVPQASSGVPALASSLLPRVDRHRFGRCWDRVCALYVTELEARQSLSAVFC